MHQIPRISYRDLISRDPELISKTAYALGIGIHEFGFVILSDCDFLENPLARLYEATKILFNQPASLKSQWIHPSLQRGYFGMGTETAKNHTLPDLKEYFHIGPEKSSSLFDADIPNNLWPDLEGTDFKDVAFSYFTAIHHTAQLVLSRFETHLGLNQGDLTRHTLYGNSVLRLLHYPPVPENDSKSGHVRAAAHEDINLITLLPHTSESGLQILPRGSKEWIPVVTQKSDIICDTGDMMTILTNGYFPATTHQVVNSEESGVQSRYSLPFFVHPDSHLVLRSFRQCKNQQTGTLHHPIKAHEYLQQRLRENGIKGNKA